ncbi:hypothetical protein T02_14066 [Trichinella nativa]|uniref:Uncharacterized protein n=1 Tax=Trichinella nativa TaxID=6335 RepID=A0A0V1LMX4_9BILA|nr:hypothetical protein T02_14066 [Trichinella nativa]
MPSAYIVLNVHFDAFLSLSDRLIKSIKQLFEKKPLVDVNVISFIDSPLFVKRIMLKKKKKNCDNKISEIFSYHSIGQWLLILIDTGPLNTSKLEQEAWMFSLSYSSNICDVQLSPLGNLCCDVWSRLWPAYMRITRLLCIEIVFLFDNGEKISFSHSVRILIMQVLTQGLIQFEL